jgi:hypothetical protein
VRGAKFCHRTSEKGKNEKSESMTENDAIEGGPAPAPPEKKASWLESSYQRGSAAEQPVIRQLDDPVPVPPWRGDASLRPNTGEDNEYEYTLIRVVRLSPNQWIYVTKFTILFLSVATFLRVGLLFWLFNLFTPLRIVLSAILLVMVAALGAAEALTMLQDHFSVGQHWNNWLASKAGPVLYHPIGKMAYTVVLAVLCFFTSKYILCGGFVITAGLLWMCWNTFPAYRRPWEEVPSTTATNEEADQVRSSQSWSFYSDKVSESVTSLFGTGVNKDSEEETKALVRELAA